MWYIQGVLEVQKDACFAGQKVVIVDDLLATGGEVGFYFVDVFAAPSLLNVNSSCI